MRASTVIRAQTSCATRSRRGRRLWRYGTDVYGPTWRRPRSWLANHGVAETEEDMQVLLLGAARMARQPISFLMPIRRAALFRWCLTQGFRAIRPMTLMTIGEYREPQGSYFPSVLY